MSRRSDKQTSRASTWLIAIAMGMMFVLGGAARAETLRRGANVGSAGVGAGSGTFMSGYYDLGTGAIVDNALRIENPTAFNGNLCAMIYVFNSSESMGECCGCLVTPNELLQESIKTLLGTGWGFSGGTPANGAIQVVSAMPNNGRLCAPQQPYASTPTLNGWITHAQTIAGISGLTEVPLTDNGAADQTESTSLIQVCGSILGNGSGSGSCTCPTAQ
jgi:hypothetical protein